MKKSKEQLQAEIIVADLIRGSNLTPEETLNKARQLKTQRSYSIAQRVTLSIILAILWDVFDDFDEAMMKEVYDLWEQYNTQYEVGDHKIFEMMNAVDDLLGGVLLRDKLFDVIKDGKVVNDE